MKFAGHLSRTRRMSLGFIRVKMSSEVDGRTKKVSQKSFSPGKISYIDKKENWIFVKLLALEKDVRTFSSYKRKTFFRNASLLSVAPIG